jgi:hypothetical protein
MTPDEHWLAEVWPFVRACLPSPPATVLDIGCGLLGGFVPALLADGYDAAGVDPEAPEGSGYHRIKFERYRPRGRWMPWWRPRRCTTWPTWARCWTGWTRRWHPTDASGRGMGLGAVRRGHGALVLRPG